jgi:hypothetical protein
VSAGSREAWLQSLVEELRPRYEGELPETLHVSVGFPSKGIRSKAIGECWRAECGADAAPQIYIHPMLADGVRVADVVVHELIHACRPDAKHGKDFREVAVRLGLTGRMTATVATDELRADLAGVLDKIGPYPHPALSGSARPPAAPQSTRMLKVTCPDCDYTVRTTRKWLDVGTPTCPCGTEMAPS